MDYDADSDEEETEEEEKTNGIIPDSSNGEIKPSEEAAAEGEATVAAEQTEDQPMEHDTTEEESIATAAVAASEASETPMEKTETEESESTEVVTTTKSPTVVEATPTVTLSTEEEGDVEEPAAKRPRTEDH